MTLYSNTDKDIFMFIRVKSSPNSKGRSVQIVDGQQFLFKPEEITRLAPSKREYGHKDYIVDLHDLFEEQRLIGGFHEVYGALYDQMG